MAKFKGGVIVDYLALAGGSIAAGVAQKVVPVGNQLVKSGLVLAAGIFLSTQKSQPVKMAGYGMVARASSDLANNFGIGDEMISAELAGESLEAELADELAEAMEAELAEEMAADADGRI